MKKVEISCLMRLILKLPYMTYETQILCLFGMLCDSRSVVSDSLLPHGL